jgi:hypothetical protein
MGHSRRAMSAGVAIEITMFLFTSIEEGSAEDHSSAGFTDAVTSYDVKLQLLLLKLPAI